MKKTYFILVALMATVITSCEKTPRPISRISKEALYPSVYSSVPCYSVFSQSGGYLFKKRMTLEARSGNISAWPMISVYDSSSAKMYKSAQGYTVISFAHSLYPTDSLKFYFRYIDWTKKLKYEFQSQNPLISGVPLDYNQSYGVGSGRFVRINYAGLYPLDLKITSGSIYLGKDPATGKKELVLCSCEGTVDDFGFDYAAEFTGRFTLPN